jgi:hypothetical protein
MRLRPALLAASALALALAAAPAGAAITMASVSAGFNTSGGTTDSGHILLNANVATSELLVVAAHTHNTSGAMQPTDSCGDAFSTAGPQTVNGDEIQFWWVYPSCAMASGTAWVDIANSVSQTLDMGAAKITGQSSTYFDQIAGAQTGTATSSAAITPAPATAALAQPAEVAIGVLLVVAGGTDGTPTQTGFTALTPQVGAVGQRYFAWGWQLTAATTAVSYAPTLASSTSRTYEAALIAFKANSPTYGPGGLTLKGCC